MKDLHLPIEVLELARFTSKDEFRPTLQYIQLKSREDNKIEANVTNGHVAARYVFEGELDHTVYLPRKEVLELLKNGSKRLRLEGAILKLNDDLNQDSALVLCATLLTLPLKVESDQTFSGHYPDIERVMPTGEPGLDVPIGFNLNYIQDLNKYLYICNRSSAAGMVATKFEFFGPLAATLITISKFEGFTFILMPMRVA